VDASCGDQGTDPTRGAGFYRALVDESRDTTLVLTPEGRIEFASAASHELLGYPPEELFGTDGFGYLLPDDVAETRARLLDVVAGAPVTHRFRVIHQDGGVRWVEGRATNRLADPEFGGVIVSLRDVSEQHASEEAGRERAQRMGEAQKHEAIGRLAGGIAHDFNNWLTAIGGYADLLAQRERTLDERSAGYVDRIRSAGRKAADLTRKLLVFSRGEVSRPEVVDLGSVVEGVVEILKPIIGEDVAVETRVDPAAGPVLIDPERLEQVIMNLAVNARDAMPGGGHLALEVGPAPPDPERPGAWVRIAVSDDGVGIPPEAVPRLFEPYFTTKEKGKGTGLGLATVRAIVDHAGGRVSVRTQPGVGTEFRLDFPAGDPGADRSGKKRPGSGIKARPKDRAAQVLVVEDEEQVRVLAAEVLEAAGFTVRTAPGGLEALESIGAERPDLVLTDVVMPAMNGLELARRVRSDFPGVGVGFMSGYVGGPLLDELERAGAPIVQKPFRAADLVGAVRGLLEPGADDDEA